MISGGIRRMFRPAGLGAASLLLLPCLAAPDGTRAQPAPPPAYVVFFAEWSAALDDAANGVITAAAAAAKSGSGPITITGFADHQGSATADAELSQLRAQVVEDALLADGIPATRMKLVAAGRQPGPAGVVDRRVEVVIGGGG